MDREPLLDVLMEEYRTLRQESLDTLGHRLTVVSFTFAALSVVVAGMLTATELPAWIVGAVGVVFVPQAAKAGLFIWLGEYQRSQRAGRHLAELERRVNTLLDVDGSAGLCWESALTSRGRHMSTPYIATIAFTLGRRLGRRGARPHLPVAEPRVGVACSVARRRARGRGDPADHLGGAGRTPVRSRSGVTRERPEPPEG